MTIGREMTDTWGIENLITTIPRRTTFVALGDPFPGLNKNNNA